MQQSLLKQIYEKLYKITVPNLPETLANWVKRSDVEKAYAQLKMIGQQDNLDCLVNQILLDLYKELIVCLVTKNQVVCTKDVFVYVAFRSIAIEWVKKNYPAYDAYTHNDLVLFKKMYKKVLGKQVKTILNLAEQEIVQVRNMKKKEQEPTINQDIYATTLPWLF